LLGSGAAILIAQGGKGEDFLKIATDVFNMAAEQHNQRVKERAH
jgi:hypothetical protein